MSRTPRPSANLAAKRDEVAARRVASPRAGKGSCVVVVMMASLRCAWAALRGDEGFVPAGSVCRRHRAGAAGDAADPDAEAAVTVEGFFALADPQWLGQDATSQEVEQRL